MITMRIIDDKNGYIHLGIAAIVLFSLIVIAGGGAGYKYYQKEQSQEKIINSTSSPYQNINIDKNVNELKKIFSEKFINSTSSLVIQKDDNVSSSPEIPKIEQKFKKQEQEQKQTVNPPIVNKKDEVNKPVIIGKDIKPELLEEIKIKNESEIKFIDISNLGKKIDVENLSKSIVKLECYYSDELESRYIGSGVIIGSKEYGSNITISDTIATAAHVITDKNDNFREADGCDVYILNQIDEAPVKRFYAKPYINYYFSKLIDENGNEIADGLDYALLQIVGFDRKSAGYITDNFPIPSDIKNIYELNEKNCDSKKELKIGEKIYILGYPPAGGDTITVSEGIINEFFLLGQEFSAKVSGGNSGGAVITEDGCFISVQVSGLFYDNEEWSIASHGISTTVVAMLGFKGDSTVALLKRDIERENDIFYLSLGIAQYFKINGVVPKTLNDALAAINNSPVREVLKLKNSIMNYRYAYRIDGKAAHIGATFEESPEQFNKYSPKSYDTDDFDFNSQNQSDWVGGFDGSDDKTCLPNDKTWYYFDGKWCFDFLLDENTIPYIINKLDEINNISNQQSSIGNFYFFANTFEIFKNLFNNF